MTSMVAPITVDDIFYGVVGLDIELKFAQEMTDNVGDIFDGSARIMIVSHNGTLARLAENGSADRINHTGSGLGIQYRKPY